MEFIELKCNECGGTLEKQDNEIYKCAYCGRLHARLGRKVELPSEVVSQINHANELRMRKRFDEAMESYEAIISKYPDETAAYWGAFLSEYGIEYVAQNDTKPIIYRPICHRISMVPATESGYLAKLYSLFDEKNRQIYRAKADEIERIRYTTYELSRTQEPSEVFICHSGSPKETECGQKLYDALVESKRKVFMPPISVPDPSNEEAYIFSAMDSAQYMLIIADSVESLEKTKNTWGRFIALQGKKTQVLHSEQSISAFPRELRLKLQRQDTINLTSPSWLNSALAFVEKKPEATVIIKEVGFDQSKFDELEKKILSNVMTSAESLPEAFVMALTYITLGDLQRAQYIINEQLSKFNDLVINSVAELGVKLMKLAKSTEAERRQLMAEISFIASRLKGVKRLTDSEREVYSQIRRANLCIYLAKCFGAIKDRERQCFMLDLVDCNQLSDFSVIGELVSMLLTNGRSEDVKEVLRLVPRIDGDKILPMILKSYEGNRQIVLMGVENKIYCTDKIVDELNNYLSTSEDLGLCLTIVEIMTANKLELNINGLSGALSAIKEVSQIKTVLNNFGSRPLSGLEVDKLIMIATSGDDVANEVLRHLKFESGVTDLGAYNMQLLVSKCSLSKIKLRLFDFKPDKKLSERLLTEAIKGNGEDRVSAVNIIAEYVPVVDIKSYSQVLLGSDPNKKELLGILVPKTGKFVDANRVIEQYLRGRDSDEDKREIFAMFEDFPLDESVLALYLSILPDSYDAVYEKYLCEYLKDRPSQARDFFVTHYERLIDGYEHVLPKILSYVKFMDEKAIVRFVADFKGNQRVKDELFTKLIGFAEKPKKIEATVKGVECNILQAYLFTVKEAVDSTYNVAEMLKKKGLSAGDKVYIGGKKLKAKEYVEVMDASEEVKMVIKKFL